MKMKKNLVALCLSAGLLACVLASRSLTSIMYRRIPAQRLPFRQPLYSN